ncbi:phage holin family protein [Parafrankia elaeagni]|uniref:phage holin family protein n=1 Tax=Parafrankia elaeagni TaxID=222534 RepID=UPI00036B2D7B|nr:phage holin family protein [Parafrankia elaeagni]
MTSALARQPTTQTTPPVDRTGVPDDAEMTVRTPVDGSAARPEVAAVSPPETRHGAAATAGRHGAGPHTPVTGAQPAATRSPVAPTTEAPPGHASSTGQLVSEVANDVSTLFRQELALAKAELREEATKAGKGAGMFAGAGGAGFFALVFILLAVMFGLGSVMALGWAALIVGVLLVAAAAVLALMGRRTVKNVHPAPTQTVETLREDVQWAQNRRH